MTIIPITEKNAHIFEILVQDYEAEFSAITHKEPGSAGSFPLEADWKKPYRGFYLFLEEKPAGFAIVGKVDGRHDIAEFYILPCYRKRGLGKKFAFEIFDRFPGPWQIRQIPGATEATAFWRHVVKEYTQGTFLEDQIQDPHWGTVTRQLFIVTLS